MIGITAATGSSSSDNRSNCSSTHVSGGGEIAWRDREGLRLFPPTVDTDCTCSLLAPGALRSGVFSTWSAKSAQMKSFLDLERPGALKARVFSVGIAQTMSCLGWERSDHELSRLGALKPCIFSAGSAQSTSFLGWHRSDHEFSRLEALKPRVFSAGSAQTMSFLCWERSNH